MPHFFKLPWSLVLWWARIMDWGCEGLCWITWSAANSVVFNNPRNLVVLSFLGCKLYDMEGPFSSDWHSRSVGVCNIKLSFRACHWNETLTFWTVISSRSYCNVTGCFLHPNLHMPEFAFSFPIPSYLQNEFEGICGRHTMHFSFVCICILQWRGSSVKHSSLTPLPLLYSVVMPS